MHILDTVEAGLKDFRPKTPRQFVVLNIATRFNDVPNLARYLNVCDHSKKELVEAARLAEQQALRDGHSPIGPFFALLDEWGRKEGA